MEKPYLKYTHLCSIVSYYSLLIVFFAFDLHILQINLAFKFTVAIIQVSPLLPFIKGLHARHFRSMIWLCFISLVYLMHGVMNMLSGAYVLFGWGEIIFSILLFISLAVSASAYQKKPKTII